MQHIKFCDEWKHKLTEGEDKTELGAEPCSPQLELVLVLVLGVTRGPAAH